MEGELTFGQAIRHLRESHGVTLRDVATAIDVKHPYVYAVECGRKAPFSDDKIELVYDTLKLDSIQRAELNVLRVVALGWLDVSGLEEDDIRELVTLRDQLRTEPDR